MLYRPAMPLLVIPYPHIDPVLVHIGPLAIRWYALAYIVGILAGWVYARALIRDGKLWSGGKCPITLAQFDDFLLWVTLGIILGGRIGYVLFYNLPLFADAPAGNLRGVERRHVVPRRLHRLRRRGGGVRAPPRHSILSLGDITCAVGPIGLFLGRLANFINGELWGRPADVPWAMVFPIGGPMPRHPSQLYEAGLEGLLLLAVLFVLIRMGALKRPGLIIGAFAVVYALRARSFSEFFREPDAQLGFLWGGATMGQLLSIPLFIAGRLLHRLCLAASRPKRQKRRHERRRRDSGNWAARSRNPPAHRHRRADAGRRNTWRCASPIRNTAITPPPIRSARAAISSPRRK